MFFNPLKICNKTKTETDVIIYKNIQFDIRNMKVLNELQMQFIKTLPHDSKNDLLEIYNQCMQLFNEIMKE